MALMLLSFLVIFALSLLAISVGLKYLESTRSRQFEEMLRTVEGKDRVSRPEVVLEGPDGAKEGLLDRLLMGFGFFNEMGSRLKQAGLDWTVSQFVLITIVMAVVGALIGTQIRILIFWQLSSIVLACLFGVLPYVYVTRKRNSRFREFEAQFPEALDFLARSMRAGHAFSISLGMLADESPEPLGPEFRKVFNEHNLGASMDEALAGLVERVPLVDVRFFVSSVLMQKEVGGNLSEILTNLAYVIRERFRVRGQVRAASAHGRLTATVLTVLPIATLLLLLVVAPGYIQSLATDPDGKYLFVYAVVSQFVGYYFIRRIIDIKV